VFNLFTKMPVNETPYILIDFFSLDLVLLGIVVLLALVLIARKTKDC